VRRVAHDDEAEPVVHAEPAAGARGPDEAVLDAALRAGLDAPYSCAGGACGTCVATLRSGTVHMAVHHALTEAEVTDGRILTCQARPTSDALTVDYDD
jgi:ferredoxin